MANDIAHTFGMALVSALIAAALTFWQVKKKAPEVRGSRIALVSCLAAVVAIATFGVATWALNSGEANAQWSQPLLAISAIVGFLFADSVATKMQSAGARSAPGSTVGRRAGESSGGERALSFTAWWIVGPCSGALAFSIIFWFPVIFLGQKVESMIGWGWYTTVPAMIAGVFCAGKACTLMLSVWNLPGADKSAFAAGGRIAGILYAAFFVFGAFIY